MRRIATALLAALSAAVLAPAAPARAADVPTCLAQVVTFSPGYQVFLTVDNTTATPVDGWTVTFTLPATATVTSSFGGTVSRSGAQGTITPLAWSGYIAPGVKRFIGFGGQAVPFTPPAAFTFNGSPCTPV